MRTVAWRSARMPARHAINENSSRKPTEVAYIDCWDTRGLDRPELHQFNRPQLVT